jgi:hypothetical protein
VSTYWADRFQLGTEPIPVDSVTQPEFFELEREKLFRRVWLNVGRVEDLPKPGAYFVKDIDVLRASLLVVRGSDGVRPLHNVPASRQSGGAGLPDPPGFACTSMAGRTTSREGQPRAGRGSVRGLPEGGMASYRWQKGLAGIHLRQRRPPAEGITHGVPFGDGGPRGYPFDSMKRMVTYVLT